MKTILTVAIAAIIAMPLPAQAAEETFGVAFAAPVVKNALRQVAPGNEITLKLNITGKASTLTITGPGIWQQEAKDVSGAFESLPFAVTNRTPTGNLKFTVKATSASGKTLEDSIEFLNVGSSTAPVSSQVAQAAPPANITNVQQPVAQQPSQVVQLRHSVQWVSPQLDTRGTQSQSSLTATTVWSLTGTPVRFGAQLRMSSFNDSAKNANGKDGMEPFIGLGGQIIPGWDVEGNLGLTANPLSGGLASWPMQLTLRSEADLPYGFRNASEAHSDFGSVGGSSRLSWALDSAEEMAFGPFFELAGNKDIGSYYGRTVARAGVENSFRLPSGHQARLTLGYSWSHNDWSNGILAGLELRPSKAVAIESEPNKPTPSGGSVVKAI